MTPVPALAAAPGSRASGPPRRDLRGAALPVALAGATLAATVLLAVRSPHAQGSYGVCPSVALLGVWCPGCGGLRAVHELATFDVVAALGMNPLVVVAVPVVVVLWVLWLLGRTGHRRPLHLSARWGWITLGGLLAFGVLRNVPALVPLLAP